MTLLGWYLMVPPPNVDRAKVFDSKAPLSQWEIVRAYDSAKACEFGKEQWEKRPVPKRDEDKKERWAMFLSGFRCIATDDPRLAK